MFHRKPHHNLEPTKIDSGQNYRKNMKRNKLVLTKNVLEIDKTKSKGVNQLITGKGNKRHT